MSYRWPGLASALFACVTALGGCSAAPQSKPTPDGGSSSIQFDSSGVLAVAPKDTVVIDLSASGVSNATLSLAGSYLDAFLDADTVDLSSGHGQFTLRAPSTATTFSILAAAGEQSARLDVSVSATGFADVRVQVDYHGKRAVPVVTASTFIETTCAQLTGKTDDGSPEQIETYGDPILLENVPTDGRVAVFVRIAHYATGCFDVASLTPGETRDVDVDVFDLPLDLADTTLETRFTFTPDSGDEAALLSYFEQLVDGAVVGASFSSSTGEASRLLDGMAAASGNANAFASARSQNGWDSATSSWLGQHGPSMHDRVAAWLVAAAQAGLGDLTGHLDGDATKPVFTPLMLGSLDAGAAGVSAPLPFAWSGQANDVLSMSGSVAIVPSELACAAADAQAAADVSGATGVPDALALSIDCDGLGDSLANGGYAFGACDGSCMSGLCSAAIEAAWSAGAAALTKTSDALSLTFSVAAPVQVVDTPEVQSYAGSWVGSFSYATTQVATKGDAKAAHGTLPN